MKSPKVVVALTLSWLRQFKLKPGEFQFSMGGIGLEVLKLASARRAGMDDTDKETPFVWDQFAKLKRIYHGYGGSKEELNFMAYAETVTLRKGGRGCLDGLDISELQICKRLDAYRVPARLQMHADAAKQLHEELRKLRWQADGKMSDAAKQLHEQLRILRWQSAGKVLNDSAVRIAKWHSASKRLELQKACYLDQVATNLTLDWASGKIDNSLSATIRSVVEPPRGGRLLPFEESCLSNTIGVATMLLTADHRILIPLRGGNQAIMSHHQGKFHCTSSGALLWKHLHDEPAACSFDAIERGMKDEIASELNLQPAEVELTPLAFSRELPRGGKPQFFFLGETRLRADEVKSRMKDAPEAWEFLPEEAIPADSPLKRYMGSPGDIRCDVSEIEKCFTYEGWAALHLARCAIERTQL